MFMVGREGVGFLFARRPYYRGNPGGDEGGGGEFNTEDAEDAEGAEEFDGYWTEGALRLTDDALDAVAQVGHVEVDQEAHRLRGKA